MYRMNRKNQIGCGTYGSVFEGVAPDGTKVALKKIKEDSTRDDRGASSEGFPITALREIQILKALSHENIVNLIDVVTDSGPDRSVYMVFEYCDHDLTGLLDTDPPISFMASQIKYYMHCIFEALYYLHSKNVYHRDIKGANILISNNGDVKLADFGLARVADNSGRYTNTVVTLWYRAPELLLGTQKYDDKIDVWSAGCVFAEMLRNGKGLFRGATVPDQLTQIYNICGTPDANDWPEARMLSFYTDPTPKRPRKLPSMFSSTDYEAVKLLDMCLQLNPKKRCSAKQALDEM